ncbi:cyclase [Gordonia spumicola]|uniref:Cyclase n=1 Tax=Gordonia spumicola TaxID=589161 RepID=A0A7I9VFL8_9ACTN|nr:SRPBCC family protein [Gordonia spumicola]GEE00240.1 cyclase [Gordonia spumicola]GEE04169.1 cyclase [Gordonia spumicola]
MRYSDGPTLELSTVVEGATPEQVWDLITDITLPVKVSPELQSVEWLDGADAVVPGARFVGSNVNPALGSWSTTAVVAEVDPGRRWVWNIEGFEPGHVMATWAFEVEPSSKGAVLRQWARMGPSPSGLSIAISRMPEKEARIVSRRLEEWRVGIQANLDYVNRTLGG